MSTPSKQTFWQRESKFITLMVIFMAVIYIFKDRPDIAMWIGFILAGYSAIANDSIQTLGTFLASNHKVAWWKLWLFIGGILVATFAYGWYSGDGDVAFGRLDRIAQPTEFNFIQLMAPIVLLVLTRFKIPVSTTFLLLSVFSTSKTITGMLNKTMIGYFLAFTTALVIWGVIAEMIHHKKFLSPTYNVKRWRLFQWAATAFLWVTWLMQDTANLAVFLPRAISMEQLLVMCSTLFVGMGILLYLHGGRIQEIVTEKTDVVDVRSATVIAVVFGVLLLIFKEWNNLPMSTTWVFLGLLAGREVSLARLSGHPKPYVKTLGLVMKDVALASVGLIISIAIAMAGQGLTFNEIFGFVTLWT
jgi:hypothetical protein